METRKLAAIVVSLCNALVECLNEGVEMIEKELAKGDDAATEKTERTSSSERRKAAAKNLDKKKKDDDDDADAEDEDDDKEKSDGDEPSEDDVVDAARAALKVLERTDVAKLIKKFGKADKASEVEPELRAKVIAELEKAVDAA